MKKRPPITDAELRDYLVVQRQMMARTAEEVGDPKARKLVRTADKQRRRITEVVIRSTNYRRTAYGMRVGSPNQEAAGRPTRPAQRN